MVFFGAHVLPAAEVASAAAEEVGEASATGADVDATAEPEANLDAEPEATAAADVLATETALELVATTVAAVLAAEAEATPPVPAAARAAETEVHAGFLERFSSYKQASPWPEKVLGTHEYYRGCQKYVSNKSVS